MNSVSFYYWAGARAAAGRDFEIVEAESVADAVHKVRAAHSDPRFDRVLSVSSLLVDGLVCPAGERDRPLESPIRIEVLPPFAGGSR